MNLTYTRPGELRKPDVKVLPDGRIRVTRYIAAGHGDRDLSEVTESFGTTDSGLNTALLVEKGMARIEGKDAIVKTWEVRNPTGETPVGNEDVQFGENGLKTVIADFVQMSTQPYTPQTVGVTASTYDATCILRNEVMDDDGSTRQIRRFYINKGLLKQVDETRNNGKLLIRSLTYLNDTPAAGLITGYTLINQNRDNPSGLPTTTYTYAQGTGQVSQDDETKNNGALLIRSIRYLSVPSVVVNPITTPTGYTKITESYVEQDGHKVWSATYAKGNGQVDSNSETRLNGMLLRTTITYLTDPSVNSNPTSDPFSTGGVVVNTDKRDVDGHRIWTVTWVKGVTTSNTETSIEYRNVDKYGVANLTIWRSKRLNSYPSLPDPNAILVESTTTSEDGYYLYSQTYAKGFGLIESTMEQRNQGMLKIYSAIGLNDLPQPPDASWYIIDDTNRVEKGVNVYTRKWAKGNGIIQETITPRNDGLKVVTWVSLNPTYDPTWMKPYGVLIEKDYAYLDGHTRWTVSSIQKFDGTDPSINVNPALFYSTKRPFTYPGRAKAYSTSVTVGGGVGVKTNYDVFKSPPVQALIDADVSISYRSSPFIPTLTYSLWNPTNWATVRSWYLGWNAAPAAIIESLPNYRSEVNGGNTVTFNGGTSGYQESAFGNRCYGAGSGTPYFITVEGGPSAPDGNTYTIEMPTLEPAFLAYDGTQFYRLTVVTATIPAQAALPSGI